MARRTVPFFLPVRRRVIEALVRDGEMPRANAELASIMAISMLRLTPELTVHNIERLLFDVQEPLERNSAAGIEHIRATWGRLDPMSVDDLEEFLVSRSLVFAPSTMDPYVEEQIGPYGSAFQQDMQIPMQSVTVTLLPSSETDDEFESEDNYDEPRPPRPVVRLTGSHQQALAVRKIVSMLDEHIDADAYAGTGKTHLIMALLASAPNYFTYITPYSSHMHGGVQAAGGLVSTLRKNTLYEIALRTAKPFAAAVGLPTPKIGKAEAPPVERARIAGIERIGDHTPSQVVDLVERAISSWCESDAEVIRPQHFMRVLSRQVDVKPYLMAAEALWAAMWATGHRGRPFTLHLSHLVKWLNLKDAPIPRTYGTLLVDEAHDLMPSWRQFLDRYSGGSIFLGDPYQRLRGRVARGNRNPLLIMNQSFRMGMQGDHAIRRALENAPDQHVSDPFEGSRSHITRVRQERPRTVELHEGLRVYANEWALLEDAQRLKAEGGSYRLLPATIRNLRKLVAEATTLYNQPKPSWMLLAGGHRAWMQLAEALEKDGRQNVVRMFERGYNVPRFEEMIDSQAREGDEKITLGLVAHVKNLESSVVTLSDCCFTSSMTKKGHEPAHAVYLAMSRVKDELWLPRDALDRLSQLKLESGVS